MGRKKELEKVMTTSDKFKLDFCTPRYLKIWKLSLDKLKVRWEVRMKIEEKNERNKEYWMDKEMLEEIRKVKMENPL